MKKIILFLLSVCLTATFFACAKKPSENAPSADLTYDMDVTLCDSTLTADQTVGFRNVFADDLPNAVFHLYPNAYAADAEYKAYYGILPSYGGIEVKTVTVNGSPVEATLDETNQYLSVPVGLAYGETVEIGFSYKVTLPDCRLRLGRSADRYLVSAFYPQLAVYRDGAFLCDPYPSVGDPSFSDVASYSVRLTCPSSLVVAASASPQERTVDEQTTTYLYRADTVRDFAFAAASDFTVASDKVGDTELYLFTTDPTDAEGRLGLLRSAYSVYTEAFGSTGQKGFSLAIMPFDHSGMEFSGFVVVSDAAGEETEEAVLHETAHQWWYDLVGSDPIRESVLDEGLTSFSTLYYYLLAGDEAAFREKIDETRRVYTQYETLQKRRKTDVSLRLDGTVYDYTAYQYTMLMYYKACMLFNNVYELYGRDKTTACLRAYAERFAHKTATLDDFVNVCNDVLKTDVGGLVAGWVGDRSTATTFVAIE